jgi:FKBP-type peptidyl-prolyl cis-trans isomerase FklB
MTRKWIAILGTCLLAVAACAAEPPALTTQKEKVSYGIGIEIGKDFRRQGIEVDSDALLKGLKDGLAGQKPLIGEEDLRKILMEFQAELKQKQMQAAKSAAGDNKKEGDAFLAENKKKEGVVTLASGLQYKILKAGAGKKPTAADTVECHYRGTLINGTEFDSSYRRGEPASFQVGGVIPGWTEALQLMPVGSKWQLFIPSQLAYGPRGAGREIGPNATLIFEVELLGIK